LVGELLSANVEYTLNGMDGVYKTEGDTATSQLPIPSSSPSPPAPAPGKWAVAVRRIFSFPALLGALLVTTVFAMGRNGLSDPDIWFHLLNAEYLVKTHKVPHVEMYSFTAAGLPWMNPEYLAEVPYYLAWRAFGLVGIKALSLLLLGLIFLGLLYICWKQSGNIKASALACYFAVFLGSVSFGPRTILFGYGYLVLLLIVLQRFRLQGKAPLWLLPPLFCLWINTHGSWSLGLIVFGIIIAGGLIGGRWGRIEAVRWSTVQLRKLLLTMGACIVALFINPYGYRLLLYPFDVGLRQNQLMVSHIEEWTSVDFHSPRGKVVAILIVGLLLGALLSQYRWKLHELGLVLFGLYTGMTYIRFLMLGALLIAPLLAKLLRFVPPYRPEIDKPVLNVLLMAAMLAFIIRGFPSSAQLQQSLEKDFPAEVLPYMKSQRLSGPVLNSYSWGGYLCWHDRNFREFIDSRCDIFVYAGIFKDYLDFIGLQHPDAVLNKYGIRYVLFQQNDPVTLFLKHDPNWKVVFSGSVSIMFERVGDPPPTEIRKPVPAETLKAW
jgi:hypothetical protein